MSSQQLALDNVRLSQKYIEQLYAAIYRAAESPAVSKSDMFQWLTLLDNANLRLDDAMRAVKQA